MNGNAFASAFSDTLRAAIVICMMLVMLFGVAVAVIVVKHRRKVSNRKES